MRIDGRTLHAALVELARVAGKSAVAPMLETVRIEARGDTVTLTTTDLTDTLRFTLPADVVAPFTVCLAARLLSKLTKPETRRKPGDVTIEPLPGHVVALTIDGVTSKLAGLDPANYPEVNNAGDDDWSLVAFWKAAAVRDALGFVLRAASRDSSRPHLQTVLLDDRVAVCSDGHRLHLSPLPSPVTEPLLLSATAGEQLRRLLVQAEHVVLSRRDDVVRVRGGHWQYETKLDDSEFPAYRQVIPDLTDQTTRLTVEIKALSRALAQVKKLSDDQGARLCINGVLTVGTCGHDVGEVEIMVPTPTNTHQGEDLLIGIDACYLQQALPRNTETASMAFAQPLDPVRVDLPGGCLAVVMPMRL